MPCGKFRRFQSAAGVSCIAVSILEITRAIEVMAERSIAAFFLRFQRGIGIRQVRLFTGLILFSYLISHFTNHALGNISIPAMEEGMTYHIAFWRSWPV